LIFEWQPQLERPCVQPRERAKMTQDQLATRTGMSPQVLSRLGRGDSDPRWSTIIRVASGLGVSLDSLTNQESFDTSKREPVPRALHGEIRATLRDLRTVTKRLAAIEQHLSESKSRVRRSSWAYFDRCSPKSTHSPSIQAR
jgi:transcriptional regulator with XRE-family HTH domain